MVDKKQTPEPSYVYSAYVVEVYDGDTVTLNLDLGCWTHLVEKCRLVGINTPEVRGKERPLGLLARDALRDLILGQEVVVETKKDKSGKYGRLLVDIYIGDLHINSWLVSEGYAEWREY